MNSLAVRFERLKADAALAADMLVMERRYPLVFCAYKVEMRESWLDASTEELQALRIAGFVHHSLQWPSNLPGERFDNILLTPNGLRLIDVGISVLRRQVSEAFFSAYVRRERARFRVFFLGR